MEGDAESTVEVVLTCNVIAHSIVVSLDSAQSLAAQVAAFSARLGVENKKVEEYGLLAAWRPEYLTAELWLDGIPPWLAAGSSLELVPLPAFEVREVLEQLAEGEEAPSSGDAHEQREQRKRRVFWMREPWHQHLSPAPRPPSGADCKWTILERKFF